MTTENALQGAKFTLRNSEAQYYYETIIEDRLVLPNIPDGDYEYTLSKKGYKTIKDNITIGKYEHLVLNLDLEKETKKTTKKTAKASEK